MGVTEKAHVLLTSGRVRVELWDGELRARVRGDHGTYVLWVEAGRWRCPCPAYGRCSHELAVSLVADLPPAVPSSIAV